MPRWLKRTLIGLSALLVSAAVVIAGILVAVRADPTLLEVPLERLLSGLLDRELEIGRIVEADVAWDAYVRAENVRLANPAWADDPDMVSAGRLTLSINLPSIWREGPVEIHNAEIEDGKLLLLNPEDHPPNWSFWPDRPEKEEPEEGEIEFPVVISQARINNGEIRYRDPDQDVHLAIDELEGREPSPDALIQFQLRGELNERPLSGEGKVGPTLSFRTGRDLQIDTTLQWGKLNASARGGIGDVKTLTRFDLQLVASAPVSKPLLELLGMHEVRDGPLSFEGEISDADPGVVFDASGYIGEFDLRAKGEARDPANFDGVDFTFQVDGPSLREAGAMLEIQDLPEEEYDLSGHVIRNGPVFEIREGRAVAGDWKADLTVLLPEFPSIDDWQIKLDAEGPDLAELAPALGVEALPSSPFTLTGTAESSPEGVELMDVKFAGTRSRISVDGIVGDAPTFQGTRLALGVSGNDLAEVGAVFGMLNLPQQDFEASAQVALDEDGWRVDRSVIEAPNVNLDWRGSVDSLVNPQQFEAEATVKTASFRGALNAYGIEAGALPDFPVAMEGRISGAPDRVVIDRATVISGDTRIAVDGLLGDPRRIDDVDLNLEGSGPNLLAFVPKIDPDELPDLPFALKGGLALGPNGIGVRQLSGTLANAEVTVDGLLSDTSDFHGSEIRIQSAGPNLDRVAGPWVEHTLPEKPFSLDVDVIYDPDMLRVNKLYVSVGETTLDLTANLNDPPDFSGSEGALAISGNSTHQLFGMLGAEPLFPDEPFTATADLSGTTDAFLLDPVDIQVGRNDVKGRVAARLEEVPSIDADLRSQFLNLRFLFPDLEENQGLDSDFEYVDDPAAALTEEQLAERVIPETPLPFDWLTKLNATLSYEVDEIFFREGVTSALKIESTVRDGVLATPSFNWDGDFSDGDSRFRITTLDSGYRIELFADARRIPLLWALAGSPDQTIESFYRARFIGQGTNLRELMASLNGALAFKGGGGRINNNRLGLLTGDFVTEIIGRVNPFSQQEEFTEIVCLAGAVLVEDGKVDVNPGVVTRTDKVDMSAGGRLDLNDESLRIAFNTRARRGIGISASNAITPAIYIGGTMANPRVSLDPKGAAVAGSLAVATAGLSILADSLWDRWVRTARNPCERIKEQVEADTREKFTDLLAEPDISARAITLGQSD